jgi:competence protein ComEC
MPQKPNLLSQILEEEHHNFWLWIPVLLGFGVAFYFCYEENFLEKIFVFAALFFASIIFSFLNRNSHQSLIFMALVVFLLGSFYAHFYQKTFLNQTQISGKIYVDVVGKVSEIKRFINPANHVEGANLVISQPVLFKPEFRTKKIKKEKSPRKIDEKKILRDFLNVEDYQEIDRKFLDFSKNYQEIDWQKNSQGQLVFPNPPQKISVNLIVNPQKISVNDVIAAPLMLEPPRPKEFIGDFDFILDSKLKKIGAYGFVLGPASKLSALDRKLFCANSKKQFAADSKLSKENFPTEVASKELRDKAESSSLPCVVWKWDLSEAKILHHAEISNSEQWFLSIREKIRARILEILQGDEAAIALAFLIGDQNQISKNLMNNIRNSGLAHLLSISGFHLALAGAIFFVAVRFLLSRSEYLAINFDLKKIAALISIFATYFYLKIAASPLPAQRAFLMVFFVLISLLLSEKINSKRAVMAGVLILVLANPFCVFNISFQLSFAAILTLTFFYETRQIRLNRNFLAKSFYYFYEIIFLSILIQIATLPFLMHSFQNVALLGFLANIAAIPLTSFLVMPLGFLALFLMPIHLEKLALLAMKEGIFLIEKIAVLTANLKFSNLTSPQLSGFGLAIAIFGLLLICLSNSKLRIAGIAVFLLSFATFSFVKKPDILFDADQKFFAIYDEKNGLVFSKELRESKKRELWMKRMGEKKFKIADFCDEEKCFFTKNNQKILVLIKRNKISEICKIEADIIVNLTAKYALPDCFAETQTKIDNLDFFQKGGHFFYFSGKKLKIKTLRQAQGNLPNF